MIILLLLLLIILILSFAMGLSFKQDVLETKGAVISQVEDVMELINVY